MGDAGGMYEVTIDALRSGAGQIDGLAGRATELAAAGMAAGNQGSAACEGWGPLGEAVEGCGRKIQQALGTGASAGGVTAVLNGMSTKLRSCADGYAQVEADNAAGLSGPGGH